MYNKNEFEKLENILYRKIISDIDNVESIDSIIEIILTEFCKVTGWAFGEAWLPDKFEEKFFCSPSYFKLNDTLDQFRKLSLTYSFKKGEGLIGTSWETKKLCWFDDVTLDSKYLRKRIAAACGIKSGFAIPVLAKDEAIAVLAFYVFEEIHKDEQLIELVTTVVKQLGMLIKRRQTEEKLIASNKLLQSLIDGIPDPIFIKDLNGKYIIINSAVSNFFKKMKEDIIGKTDFDLFPYKDAQRIHLSDLEVIEKKITKVLEEQFNFDETKLQYFTSKSIFFDERENVAGILGIARNITEIKNKEKEILKSEQKYKEIFDNAIEGFFQTSIDGKIIAVNKAFAKIFGFESPEDFEADNFTVEKLYPDPKIRQHIIKELSEVGIIKSLKAQALKKNGEKIWVSVNVRIIKDDEGNPQFLEGSCTDITDIKDAEDLSLKFFSAIEQTADSVIITDINGIIQYVNPAFENTSGYSAFEVIGKTPRIVKSGQHPDSFFKNLWDTILSGDVYRHIVVNRKKNGELFYTQKTITPLKDENGKIINFISTDKDITEQMIAHNELVMAKEKAEEMNNLKTYFLANMSHELRTPMIGILGFSEILKNELTNDFHNQMIDTLYDSGKRLSETLNLILDLTKIESQKYDIKIKVISANETLKEIVPFFYKMADKKEIKLNYIEKDSDILLNTDEYMFKVIVKNIINNSIKFTTKGSVDVELYIKDENKKKWVVVKVKDSGVGIPKDKHKIIFEEFRQVSEGLSRGYEGTGLGLTIAKKFMEILYGKIELESEENVGSTFTLLFPYSKTKIRSQSKVENLSIETIENKISEKLLNILFVEDDEISIRVINRYLQNLAVLNTTKNADSALNMIKETQFDIILLDINLGSGKTGLDIIKDIKLLNNYNKVPIIAVTSYAMIGDQEEFLKAGCTHYISKPFTRREFLDLIFVTLTEKY